MRGACEVPPVYNIHDCYLGCDVIVTVTYLLTWDVWWMGVVAAPGLLRHRGTLGCHLLAGCHPLASVHTVTGDGTGCAV